MYGYVLLLTLASGGTKLNTFGTSALTATGNALPDSTSVMVRMPFSLALRGGGRLRFVLMELAGTNSYTVPQTAGGNVSKETP